MGGYIFIDREDEQSNQQMRQNMRNNMRRGYRNYGGSSAMMRDDESYRQGYHQGYKEGWEDSEYDMNEENFRRQRDSRGRFM